MIGDTLYYILCAVLSLGVLYGIFLMSKVEKASLGNKLSACCMLFAIVINLLHYNIIGAVELWSGILIGAGFGCYLTNRSKMIQMPQLVALLNGFGGLASSIAAALVLLNMGKSFSFESFTGALALAVGAITFSGSMIAAGKLHRVLPQKPVNLAMHSLLTGFSFVLILLFVLAIGLGLGMTGLCIALCLILSLLFGILFAIRVGGADMPITISLLNSTSGLAAAIAGMAINDILLVSVGSIVGASGLLLTQIMCRAMNRKLSSILFARGAKKQEARSSVKNAAESEYEAKHEGLNSESPECIEGAAKEEKKVEKEPEIKQPAREDAGAWLKDAKEIIIVPGYGMAISQAQSKLKMLADELREQGKTVRYAIHPVAGRMPGHMNVLLAEVDVPYDDLYEMEAIDGDFEKTDVAIVVGANDVLNPAANTAEGTPIYGMPVLSVDKAKRAIICNFDDKPGYAGVPNPLYEPRENVILIFGDAKETLSFLYDELRK